MPTVTLTEKAVRRNPPKSGRLELFDTVLPGFGIRISATGHRSYFIMTRVAGVGRQVRVKIGTPTSHKLSEARDAARAIIENAGRGVDPETVKRRERIEAERARRNTFRVVAEEFLKRRAADLRSKGEMEARLERDVFPTWGGMAIKDITRSDVRALLTAKAESHPVAANRMLALIRPIFGYALDEELLDASPVVRIKPPGGKETARDRVLTDEEIRRVWEAFDGLGHPFGPMFKVLLLTGQRRNEVAGMRWAEIDGDTWTIPAERMKGGKPHAVPLVPAVAAILAEVPRMVGENDEPFVHVFTSARRGDRPVSGFGKIKERIDKAIVDAAAKKAKQKPDAKKHGIPAWTYHDLRRTARTNLPRLGIGPDTAERVLGHVIGGIRGVYDLHAYAQEKRRALEVWAAHVESVVTGKAKPDNLLAFKVP